MGMPLTTAQWKAIAPRLKNERIKEVWEVVISDCESDFTAYICATKEIALKKMFEYRDKLIKEYKRMLDYDKEMYGNMIKAIEGDDYEKWHIYLHECPSIRKTKVIF